MPTYQITNTMQPEEDLFEDSFLQILSSSVSVDQTSPEEISKPTEGHITNLLILWGSSYGGNKIRPNQSKRIRAFFSTCDNVERFINDNKDNREFLKGYGLYKTWLKKKKKEEEQVVVIESSSPTQLPPPPVLQAPRSSGSSISSSDSMDGGSSIISIQENLSDTTDETYMIGSTSRPSSSSSSSNESLADGTYTSSSTSTSSSSSFSSSSSVSSGGSSSIADHELQQDCSSGEVALYRAINSITGTLGGNVEGGPIYGELTQKSMQDVIKALGKKKLFMCVHIGINTSTLRRFLILRNQVNECVNRVVVERVELYKWYGFDAHSNQQILTTASFLL